jgi:hypothetical protein
LPPFQQEPWLFQYSSTSAKNFRTYTKYNRLLPIHFQFLLFVKAWTIAIHSFRTEVLFYRQFASSVSLILEFATLNTIINIIKLKVLLIMPNTFSWIFIVQEFVGIHVTSHLPLWHLQSILTHYPHSEPTSLDSFMRRA